MTRNLSGCLRFYRKPYPYPQYKQTVIEVMVRDIDLQKLVEPSNSPWATPLNGKEKILFIPSVSTIGDLTTWWNPTYTYPELNELIRQMRDANIFSIFFISRVGTDKISLHKNARNYTAFRTRGDFFQFLVLLLVSKIVQRVRLMNEVIEGY